MTAESNNAITIVTSCDWLKSLAPVFHWKTGWSNEKQNQNQSHHVLPIFLVALSKLKVNVRNSDWFIALFAPVVIGLSNNFGFGFSTVIWKPLYVASMIQPLVTRYL